MVRFKGTNGCTRTYGTISFIDKVTTGPDAPFYQRGLGIGEAFGEINMVNTDPEGTGPGYDMN